jgi:hypothetical protein
LLARPTLSKQPCAQTVPTSKNVGRDLKGDSESGHPKSITLDNSQTDLLGAFSFPNNKFSLPKGCNKTHAFKN